MDRSEALDLLRNGKVVEFNKRRMGEGVPNLAGANLDGAYLDQLAITCPDIARPPAARRQ